MSDFSDPIVAKAALDNPATSAVDLSTIAQLHPELRTQVAMHPAVYDGLLGWLAGLGDPSLAAVVAIRRAANQQTAAMPPMPPMPPQPSGQQQPTGSPFMQAQPSPSPQPIAPSAPPALAQSQQPIQPLASSPQPQVPQPQQPSAQPLIPVQPPQPSPPLQPMASSEQQVSGQSELPQPPVPVPPSASATELIAQAAYPAPPAYGSGPTYESTGPVYASTDPSYASAGPVGYPPIAPGSPQPQQKSKGRKLLIAIAVGVLVLAVVVSGFLTRGFGLFASGGAATPEEEGVRLATKTVELFNSFSLQDLLNNPLNAMGALDEEIAPSEARLYSSVSSVNMADLLGITSDTTSLVTEILGSFKAEVSNLETEVNEITDDIAFISYVGGTITVTADTEKLRGALAKLPDIVTAQIVATANKYGLSFSLPDQLSNDWVDEAIDAVEDNFPLNIELADYADWLRDRMNSDPPNWDIASFYLAYSTQAMVKEQGRWYYSPLLSSLMSDSYSLASDLDFSSEARQLFTIEGSSNDSPVAAAEALGVALESGDVAEVIAELPLAERRYVALYVAYMGDPFSGSSIDVKYDFSEISRNGQQAKLRLDALIINGAGIEDGSCFVQAYESYCLTDFLKPGTVSDVIDAQRPYLTDSRELEEMLGITASELLDKFEVAGEAAIAAIDPEQIGLVVLEEDGSWHVSVGATASDLSNQLLKAIESGLKAAQR